MRILYLFSLLILFVSCKNLQAPELKGGEKFDIEKIEGKKVTFTAGAKVYNGNWFGIRIKPSKFDLYVEDELLGEVSLDKKVKLKKKSEKYVEAPFTAELKEGAMLKLMAYAAKGQVKVRLKGKAKGGVFIFSKKIDIDMTKTVPTSKLKVGS